MAKVKVEVIGAYVDEHGPGSIVSVDEKMADYLERIGYGKKIEVEVEKSPKAEPKERPIKKTTKKKPTKKD